MWPPLLIDTRDVEWAANVMRVDYIVLLHNTLEHTDITRVRTCVRMIHTSWKSTQLLFPFDLFYKEKISAKYTPGIVSLSRVFSPLHNHVVISSGYSPSAGKLNSSQYVPFLIKYFSDFSDNWGVLCFSEMLCFCPELFFQNLARTQAQKLTRINAKKRSLLLACASTSQLNAFKASRNLFVVGDGALSCKEITWCFRLSILEIKVKALTIYDI